MPLRRPRGNAVADDLSVPSYFPCTLGLSVMPTQPRIVGTEFPGEEYLARGHGNLSKVIGMNICDLFPFSEKIRIKRKKNTYFTSVESIPRVLELEPEVIFNLYWFKA